MALFDTIFARRSVRQYDNTPLCEAGLAEIQQELDGAKQLPDVVSRFEIVNSDRYKGCAAPHAIFAYADDSDIALANIGYTLQGMDLYLQSKGYGSVWSGMGKPFASGADYRILLAFGRTDVPMRKGENDFKRKRVAEISNEDNVVSRAARLAPSAVNSQPWKLNFEPGKVTVLSNSRGIGKMMLGGLQKIDLGIFLRTVEIALEHEGKAITAITPNDEGKHFRFEVSYQ